MEDILTQKFSYGTITLFKDYSKIENRSKLIRTKYDLDGIDDEEDLGYSNVKRLSVFLDDHRRPKVGRMVDFHKQIDKRKTRFFYGDSEIGERINMNYAIHKFETRNDRHIKRHYGNPFSEITINTIERSIRRHGDKITVKVYRHHSHRQFNSIYFRKSMSVDSLTFNVVTGNFTTLSMNKVGKKTTKTFRTNNFNFLEQAFREGGIINLRKPLDKDSVLLDEHNETFDNKKFVSTLNDVFNFNQQSLIFDGKRFVQLILERFVELKQIKVSNDYGQWIKNYYPTEKFLKKNDRKLIASILDMFEIKSKITIKIMHANSDLDIFSLSHLCYLFGENYSKYIGSIDLVHFVNSKVESPTMLGCSKFNFAKENKLHGFDISNIEKENIVKILNNLNCEVRGYQRLSGTNETLVNRRFIGELHDHLSMIKKLRTYVPDLRLKSKNVDEFNKEHSELTKMMRMIKKGWVTEYVFVDKMVDDVEKPVTVKIDLENGEFGEITFYPHILKREEEYGEEGDFMHHCVATYADKYKSIIVSIRTENQQDRVTCEFDCQTGRLIQARHFCNRQPPGDMELAVQQLEVKTKYYARMGLLHSLETKKSPVKINGIELLPQHREPIRGHDVVWGEHGMRNVIPF